MAVGVLHAEIKLDEPETIHYGSADPVTGNVILRFRSSFGSREQQFSEFFGPLRMSVTLHGRLKSKIRVSRSNANGGSSSSTYRGRVPLFSRNVTIFDNSAKIASGERWPVPFAVSFPDGFESPIVGDWKEDGRFNCRQEQPLPPSFVNSYSGFSNQYDAFIEYRVGVTIHAPHIKVDIIKPDKYTEPLVYYQWPKVPQALPPKYSQRRNSIRISNELLLPESDRPKGFRQKLKAGLSSNAYPNYNFDWQLLTPQHIYQGQPIAFEVRARPRDGDNTAIVVPDIHLRGLHASLTGYTVVRAEKQFFTSPEADHDDVVGNFRCRVDSTNPFSKANDWTIIANTTAVPENLPSTFRTVNISHTHTMQVTLTIEAAGKRFSYEPVFKVDILPPLMKLGASAQASCSNAAAGSSSQAFDMKQVDEASPRYEERLPQYDEAIDSRPEPPSKQAQPVAAEGIP